MILEKENAVLANRELMGATNPNDAKKELLEKNMEFQLIKIQFMDQIVLKMQK